MASLKELVGEPNHTTVGKEAEVPKVTRIGSPIPTNYTRGGESASYRMEMPKVVKVGSPIPEGLMGGNKRQGRGVLYGGEDREELGITLIEEGEDSPPHEISKCVEDYEQNKHGIDGAKDHVMQISQDKGGVNMQGYMCNIKDCHNHNHGVTTILAPANYNNYVINNPNDANDNLKDPTKIKAMNSEGLPVAQRKSTFFQATLNCVSMLYGLGILSSPFAVAQAGWAGAVISLLVSAAYGYAAHLMARCVAYSPKCGTYQEVASVALGRKWRHIITALFYIEITGTLVGYCISVGDNLDYIFPNAGVSLPGLTGRNLMMFIAALIILPSVWLRDLSALSFTSMWCIASTICLLIAVLLAATVNHIGFTHPLPIIRLPGVPVAAGLYAFSYGGTSVFPSIYTSMQDPTKFTTVLWVSFLIATSSMAGLGIVGAYMFGDQTASQVTLSMPVHLITTKIILWMTVVTPMFKFALQLSPITTALETSLCHRWKTSKTMLYAMSTLMRSMVLASIVIFSMVFPYFEYIVALVGSSMTISICMIFPCIFYLKFYWSELKTRTIVMIILLVVIGVIVGVCGTIVSVQGLVTKRSN